MIKTEGVTKTESSRRINPRFTALSLQIKSLIAQSAENNDSFLPPIGEDSSQLLKKEQ